MSAPSVRPQRDEPPCTIDELSGQVHALTERVTALEQYLHIGAPAAAEAAVSHTEETVAQEQDTSFGGAANIAGMVLLGIAGAYLLRAFTETGVISHAMGVGAGFLYAAAWLYFAVRTAPQRRVFAMACASTSILILGPLLFEASQRFHAISGWTAAGVITAFALTAVALCWNKPGSPVPVIITAGSAAFALVLLVALRDMLPFTVALLVIAAAVESAACFDRETTSRGFLAMAANLALIVCAVVAGAPGGLPEGYAPVPIAALVAAQIALLVIYVTSTAARTIVQQRKFTNFETIQTALAFAIGLGGALHIARASGTGIAAIGVFALFGGMVCYLVSFVFIGREGKRDRNFFTYSTFALLLTIAGSYLLFGGITLAAAWCAFALACCWAGMRAERHVLELHASGALLLAALVSGAILQPREQFFGNPIASIATGAEWVVVATAFLACLTVLRSARQRTPSWDDRLAGVVFAFTLGWCLSGLLAHGLTLFAPNPAATWGTLVLVAAAGALTVASVHWARMELRALVFLFLLIGAYKLLVVDLREAQALSLAVSLLLYGGALVVLPRVLRSQRTAAN